MHLLQQPEQALSHISSSFVQAAPGRSPPPEWSHSTGPPPVSPDALDDVVAPDELPPEPVFSGLLDGIRAGEHLEQRNGDEPSNRGLHAVPLEHVMCQRQSRGFLRDEDVPVAE